jgi:hypothetical protein
MPRDPKTDLWQTKDERPWRIGGATEVAWIVKNTTPGLTITSGVPPVFEAYATLELPGSGDHDAASPLEDPVLHDTAVLAVLSESGGGPPWWLGYLDTGVSDIVFRDAPAVKLYPGWDYVLVEAGPEQAGAWRNRDHWKGVLPDLMFPPDHSWLFSTLWDDDWTCIGGSRELIDAFRGHPSLGHRVHEVDPSTEDATPPGHIAF